MVEIMDKSSRVRVPLTDYSTNVRCNIFLGIQAIGKYLRAKDFPIQINQRF